VAGNLATRQLLLHEFFLDNVAKKFADMNIITFIQSK